MNENSRTIESGVYGHRTHEQMNFKALCKQDLHKMLPDKPGATGDQNFLFQAFCPPSQALSG